MWGILDLQLTYSKLLYIYLIAQGWNLSSTWGHRDINLSACLQHINNMENMIMVHWCKKSNICKLPKEWWMEQVHSFGGWGECKNRSIIVLPIIKSVKCTISNCPFPLFLVETTLFFLNQDVLVLSFLQNRTPTESGVYLNAIQIINKSKAFTSTLITSSIRFIN